MTSHESSTARDSKLEARSSEPFEFLDEYGRRLSSSDPMAVFHLWKTWSVQGGSFPDFWSDLWSRTGIDPGLFLTDDEVEAILADVADDDFVAVALLEGVGSGP